MNVGAFVCSCADTCDIDLEETREGVRDIDVVASSSLLCEKGMDGVRYVVDEHDLDHLIVTTPESSCQDRFRDLLDEMGLHPEAVSFVDQREGAGWVHAREDATDKTARMINREYAALDHEPSPHTVESKAGETVAVVGDPETASALADTADVTLVADGRDFADVDYDLEDVDVERGRVVGVDGAFGAFELTLASRVTEDCVSCMKCVHDAPDDDSVTASPVDILPEATTGEWMTNCPTDAIEPEGVERTLEVDQVVYPDADPGTRGGRIGFYTGYVDAGTIASVEDLLGGLEKPDPLDLEMDVCAAGASSQQGCTACVDACPHGAVERPNVDEVSFDKTACQDCGACTSACPTGATKLRDPSNERIAREVEAMLTTENDEGGWLFDRGTDGIDEEVVAFVCSERAARSLRQFGRMAGRGSADVEYPPVLPVRVDCTDTVGEAHAMHALAAGADGVALVGCGDDCLHSGPDPKAALVDRLERATTDLGLGKRVEFFAPEPGEPDEFVAALGEFVDRLDESPVPSGEHEATGDADTGTDQPAFNSHDWTLESVRAVLEHASPERDVVRGLKDFGVVDVSDDCTFTPTCSNLCPTDALRREEAELEFDHERCVNCGTCEEGCMEDAITVDRGLDLRLLPEHNDGDAWVTVAEGEMLECRNCGKEFTSTASAERVEEQVGEMVAGVTDEGEGSVFEYCGDCRTQLVYDV